MNGGMSCGRNKNLIMIMGRRQRRFLFRDFIGLCCKLVRYVSWC